MKKILTPLLVSLWLAVNLPVLQAADLPVPGQFSSIQAAINAANSGDRVIVSPGTYNENITLKSGVTVQGCGPDACIIQGNGTTATVFGNQLTAATTIDGFTITGGAGFTVPWSENRIMGGGIFADASIINIGHNRIVSNQAQIGGGIALMNSRFNIVANTISSNQATTPNLSSFNIGGGVYLLDSTGQLSQNDILSNTVSSGPSNPTRVDDSANLAPGGGIAVVFSIPMGDIKILSNRVSGNATSGSQNYGGGVYLFQSSADLGNRVFLLGNTISENDGLDGGGIAAVLIEPIILGNRFTGNTGHWGGAIYGFSGGGIIAHNVVDGNSSIEIRQGVNTGGGGILCDQDFTPFMAHNTFQNNTAKDYGGAVEVFDSGSSAVLWKNLFEGNSARFGGGVVVSAASPDIVGNYFSNNNATTESGGGLFVERTTGVSVANNIFSSNSAGRFGGGVALVDAGQTAFSNNTLYANTAAPAWWGGGLYMFNGSLSFQNNIVSRNGTYGVGLDGAGTMQRQYDDFFANSGENCFRCPPGTGEIVADPRFTDTIGFRLNTSSPNVNAGNPDPAFNDPDGSRNDIGAYGGARAGDIPLPSGASGSKPSFDSSTSILSLPNTDLAVGGNRVSLQMKLTSCASAPGVVALKLQSFSAASELDAARGAFYRAPYLVVREATVGGRDYDAVLSLYSCASDPDGVYGKLEALAASLWRPGTLADREARGSPGRRGLAGRHLPIGTSWLMKKLKLLFSCLLPLVSHPSNLLPSVWALVLRLRISGVVGVKEGLLAIRDGTLLQSNSHLWKAYQEEREELLRPIISTALDERGPHPSISVLMPTYNTPPKLLRKAVESVRSQWYRDWDLCICDDGSTDRKTLELLASLSADEPRIRVKLNSANGNISITTNAALSLARGEYVVLMDHDDLLQPQALYRIAEQVRECRPDFIYSDEARITSDKDIVEFVFRPQFSLERLRAHPYIVHLIAFKRSFLNELGGLNESLRISQDYDLILRAAERAETIAHIPEVMYLWRNRKGSAGHLMQKEVMDTSISIVQSHLDRCNQPGKVGAGEFFNFFEVRYPIRPGLKVAVIVPTRNAWELVRQCIESLESTIENIDYSIVVIDHQSDEPESVSYFESLRSRGHSVLRYDGEFNFSRINNFAVGRIGEGFSHYLFCNNDIEATEPGWLERMAELGQQEDVAVVGAKLLYGDKKTIQHGGVGVGIFAAAEHYGKFADNFLPDGRHNPGYQGNLVCNQEVSAVTGACMLMDSAVFRDINGFEERLAVGFGDVDLCLRARALGYRVLYCPHATLLHYESRTRGVHNEHPEDTALFRKRWGDYMEQGDPYFNRNFSTKSYHWAMKGRLPVTEKVQARVAGGGCGGLDPERRKPNLPGEERW